MIETPTRFTFHNTTETEPGWLSPSSIVEFLRCGQCFYLNRIRKLPRPLGVNLPIGSAIHKAVEQVRLRGIEPTRLATHLDAGQVAADWFDQEVAQPTDEETGEALDILEIDLGSKYSNLGQAKDDVVRLARFVVPEIIKLDDSRGPIAAVEYNLSMLESPWPFAIQGRLDVLYGDAAKPELAAIMADLKSSKNQSTPDEMTAIAQSIYREFWLSRSLPLIAFADVASKDKHPSLQSYPLVADDYARKLTYQTVLDVAEDISEGRFRPHPGWWCSYIHGYPSFQVAVNGFAEVGE